VSEFIYISGRATLLEVSRVHTAIWLYSCQGCIGFTQLEVWLIWLGNCFGLGSEVVTYAEVVIASSTVKWESCVMMLLMG
jgi:hypothetical protein